MKFLSLFDGCHMFGHALRSVGAECVGTSEIDKHAAAVTAHHYPKTPALGDVRNVETTTADLIVAGFPCQDLSVAGDRRGLAGERSGLFWEIIRIARDNATPWLLLENVPGLLSSNGGRDMGAVLGALGKLGYGWAYRVLDAQHFGVPQRRRRVFIVGSLGSSRRASEVLFERESVRGDSAPSREAGASSARITSGRAGNWRWPADVAPTLEKSSGLGNDQDVFSCKAAIFQPVVADFAQMTSKTNGSNPQPGDPAPTMATSSRLTAFSVSLRGRDGGSVAEVGGPVSHALRASQGGGDKPHALTGGGVRRLMPIECERLQGLPDDWTKHGRKPDGATYEQSDSARYRMIGNGGAVPVVEWIGRRIMGQHDT